MLRVQLSDASTASSDGALLEASADKGTAWDLPRPPEGLADAAGSPRSAAPDVSESRHDACPDEFFAIRDKFFAGEIDDFEMRSQLRAVGALAAERDDSAGLQSKPVPTKRRRRRPDHGRFR